MKKWIEDLLALQEVDKRIKELNIRLSMAPKEKDKHKAAIEAEKNSLKSAKDEAGKVELEIKKVESEIAKVNGEIQKFQTQSSMVKKNDEYKALLNEVENCKRKISELETQEILLLDESEKRKEEFKAIEKVHGEKLKSMTSEIKELEQLEEGLRQELKNLADLRKQKESLVEKNVLPEYTRLMKAAGTPFVPVKQGVCGNCHLKVTPQTINETRKEGVVKCDNCSHLLYLPDSEAINAQN